MTLNMTTPVTNPLRKTENDMKRRHFIKTATGATIAAAAVASSNQVTADHHEGPKGPQILAWRKYIIENAAQREIIDRFLRTAAIPALNRLGVKPIGVFYDKENKDDLSVYTLAPFASLEACFGTNERLAADSEFLENANEYLSTQKDSPAYSRIESSIMRAFDGFPMVKAPLSRERIFELRTYESHNELKAILKVEMFNEAELDIFEKVDLKGVFYGQSLSGANLPNLTYMIAYENMDERKAAWGRFSKHPDWQILKKNDRYKDTVSKIVATFLVPADYSQI